MDQIRSRHTPRLLFVLLLSGFVTGMVWAQAPTPPAATPAPAAKPAPAVSTAASPKVETPEPPDKVVLKVGDQQFTKADMDLLIKDLPPQLQRAIAAQGMKSFGEWYARMVTLSQQARLHHLDKTPEFIRLLAFEEQQMEAQAEVNQQAKVTPEEIQQYYTAHAADYDEILVRQIIVRKKPPVPPAAPGQSTSPAGPVTAPMATAPQPTPGQSTVPKGPETTTEDAKTRAEAIRKEIVAGTDIKKVMEEFKASGDVIIEPEPRKIRHGGMPPDLEKVAFALKDGKVSEPRDLPQRLVMVQVTEHSHLDLKDVSPEIERILQKQKVDAALEAAKNGANVWMDDQYFPPTPKHQERPTMGAPAVMSPPKP